MKDSDINWNDAPTDAAVWIESLEGAEGQGWFEPTGLEDDYVQESVLDVELDICVHEHMIEGGWFTVHHRPEQPTKAEEWDDGLPPEGVTCLAVHKSELVECKYIGKGIGEEFIYQVSSGNNRGAIDRLIGRPSFRPLKTAEEKKREYNYGEILKMLNLIHASDFCPVKAASVLAHEGFTAPKGGE